MAGFIGVHIGAGQHSESKKQEYSKLCKAACRVGCKLLAEGKSALEAATEAVAVLENSPFTNAGLGSNLTWDGTVECDACAMDGTTGLWGAVGAVGTIKNPCRAASKLCLGQRVEGTLGRIPPCVLVGQGASDWAKKQGITSVDSSALIHASALKKYNKYKKRILKCEKSAKLNCDDLCSDTVGAVCIDNFGHTASVCSSGGIVLKNSGRLGQACMFGAGCWATDGDAIHPAVATCTTGCGEHLIRCTLAKSVADKLGTGQSQPCASHLHNVMVKEFLENRLLQEVEEKMGGVLALVFSPRDGCGELLWCHSTQTMALGYMQVHMKPKFKLSQLPAGKVFGKGLIVEGTTFVFPSVEDKIV
ncbi:threonine aspartase 1 [Neocloeon triangulifer]|uniref:threonine aspartase 1 n=1 Tax=Neocloeon triangulifer TaxID=2078957 RepID=UPI00286F66E9|nr:threonine aspartase 1 [Neocloeon triangulifer]